VSYPEVSRLVGEWLDDPGTGWSMGTSGAIAEFTRDAGEPVERSGPAVVTARGALVLDPPPELVARAYETPVGPGTAWNHAVALCLPTAAARRAARTVVTELGADAHAARRSDRDAVLFDLGLGTPTVDVCVRTRDPELLAVLRAAEGRALFEPGSSTAGAVVVAGPHRVLGTALGRVEVYSPIPPPDGRSPDGPHTHLLPHLIRPGRTHPPTVPVPPGTLPVGYCYPPHPAADQHGRRIPFDRDRHLRFQELLSELGDPELLRLKRTVRDGVRAGATPTGTGTGPAGRATVSVALRQLARLDGDSAALASWRRAHGPDRELLDPHGDRNAG
jgi:hypothetical protein